MKQAKKRKWKEGREEEMGGWSCIIKEWNKEHFLFLYDKNLLIRLVLKRQIFVV
ncbi:MAG: hypothetical protein U1F57_06010 [bacterium]